MRGRKHPTQKIGRNPVLTTASSVDASNSSSNRTVKPKGNNLLQKVSAPFKKVGNWFTKLNRHTQLAIALGFLLLIVGLIVFITTSSSPQPSSVENESTAEFSTASSQKAKVKITEGTLQLKDEQGQWQDVSNEQELSEGAVLRTVGATSRANIALHDGSELRIAANSEVVLSTLSEERIVIRHVSGYSFSRVAEADRKYVVDTEIAQYEAVGTAFRTIASGDEDAVEVYDGTVLETSTNKRPGSGQKLIVESRAKPADTGLLTKLDIEQIKNDDFIQWNRSLDLANEAFKSKLGFLQDFDAPELSITSPQDNEVVLLEPDATEGAVEIKGKTEKGATLTVQSKSQSGSQPVNVTVTDSGEFTTPVLSAPLGTSVFTFISKDRNGNTAELSVRYTFQKKSAPITSGALLLSGEKKGNKVELTWTLSGSLQAPDGVYIVYSKTASPEYKKVGVTAVKAKGSTVTIDSSDLDDNTTYFFRACIYNKDADTCSQYSSQVEIKNN